MEIIERFEKKFIPVTDSGCWLWLASCNRRGYGQFMMTTPSVRPQLAHRVSWRLYRGEIPDGKHVLHKCDTPSCVNPDHLFIGTDFENVHDMIRKGRMVIGKRRKGSSHPMSKLTEDQALSIHRDVRKQREIADFYGISLDTVKAIHQGRLWSHLTGGKK
jgi:hypothetical protein